MNEELETATPTITAARVSYIAAYYIGESQLVRLTLYYHTPQASEFLSYHLNYFQALFIKSLAKVYKPIEQYQHTEA